MYSWTKSKSSQQPTRKYTTHHQQPLKKDILYWTSSFVHMYSWEVKNTVTNKKKDIRANGEHSNGSAKVPGTKVLPQWICTHMLVENKTHENRNQTNIERSANQNGRTQDKSEHKMESPRWTYHKDRSKQLHTRKKNLYYRRTRK